MHNETKQPDSTFPQVCVQLVHMPRLLPQEPLDSPEAAADFLSQSLGSRTVEALSAIMLDCRSKPLCHSTLSIGTLTETVYSPAELARTAILSNACGVVLLHNHPSGCLIPSKQDESVARNAHETLALFHITLYDFIITDGLSFYSFRQEQHGVFASQTTDATA